MRRRLAWIISRIFDPMLEIPLVIGMSVWFAVNPSLRQTVLWWLLAVDAIGPAVFVGYLLLTKKAGDLDFTKREERKPVYVFVTLCHLLGMVGVWYLKLFLLLKILLVFWLIVMVFMWINSFWKISVHAGMNALVMFLLIYFWNWRAYGVMMAILIAVLWSRVKIKKHTLTQVMAGGGLAILLCQLGFWLLGV